MRFEPKWALTKILTECSIKDALSNSMEDGGVSLYETHEEGQN